MMADVTKECYVLKETVWYYLCGVGPSIVVLLKELYGALAARCTRKT